MKIRSEFKVKSEYPNYWIEAENEYENFIVKMFRDALNDSAQALEYILREYFGMNYSPLFTYNVVFVDFHPETEEEKQFVVTFDNVEIGTTNKNLLKLALENTETISNKAVCALEGCGKQYMKLRSNILFCSKQCQTRAKNLRYKEKLKAKEATSELPVPEVPAADQAPVPDTSAPSKKVDVESQKAKLAQIAKDIPISRNRPVYIKDL